MFRIELISKTLASWYFQSLTCARIFRYYIVLELTLTENFLLSDPAQRFKDKQNVLNINVMFGRTFRIAKNVCIRKFQNVCNSWTFCYEKNVVWHWKQRCSTTQRTFWFITRFWEMQVISKYTIPDPKVTELQERFG